MPTFDKVTVSIEEGDGSTVQHDVDVEFEVFCGDCGAGLCQNAETRHSYNRRANQVTVTMCDKCKGRMQDEIDELKAQVADLTDTVDSMKEDLP